MQNANAFELVRKECFVPQIAAARIQQTEYWLYYMLYVCGPLTVSNKMT